jgi:excisionase family DNA binding protein
MTVHIEGPPNQTTKLAYSILEVAKLSGRCRTSIYEAINAGQLRAVKSGRRTLVLTDDLHSWLRTFVPISPKIRHEFSRKDGPVTTTKDADVTGRQEDLPP